MNDIRHFCIVPLKPRISGFLFFSQVTLLPTAINNGTARENHGKSINYPGVASTFGPAIH